MFILNFFFLIVCKRVFQNNRRTAVIGRLGYFPQQWGQENAHMMDSAQHVRNNTQTCFSLTCVLAKYLNIFGSCSNYWFSGNLSYVVSIIYLYWLIASERFRNTRHCKDICIDIAKLLVHCGRMLDSCLQFCVGRCCHFPLQ